MAEAILAAELPRVTLSSAGLGAVIGSAADPIAISIMKEIGYDISDHRATQVALHSVNSADLILTMEDEQRRRLEAMYPQACGRTYRLGHFGGTDIRDPYLRGEQAFRSALEMIQESVGQWLPRINKL